MENSIEYGMKWHKFLIYFSTWAEAISCLIVGMGALSVGSNPPGRYRGNDDMIGQAAILGIVMIACGICFILVRFRLAKFKEGAYNHLTIVQTIGALASTLFTMLDMDASFTGILPSLAVIALTRYYYSKRAALFVN